MFSKDVLQLGHILAVGCRAFGEIEHGVCGGWNDQAVRAVLLRIDPAQTTLF